MPQLTVDIIGGSLETDYSKRNLPSRGTRIAVVRGLTAETTARNALAYAKAYLLSLYPPGSPYDDDHPISVLRHVRAGSIIESGDAARFDLVYDTPEFGSTDPGGGGTPLVISDRMTSRTVQSQKSPRLKVPLLLNWHDVDNPTNAHPEEIGTYTFEQMIRVIVLTGFVRSADLDPFREQAGKVDSGGFMGETRPGFWRFSNFASETVGRIEEEGDQQWYRVSAEIMMKTQPKEDWSTWLFYRSPQNGRFLAPPEAELAGVEAEDYEFGGRWGNGFIRIGPYETVSLTNVLGIGG
jgi:hypothetical protein